MNFGEKLVIERKDWLESPEGQNAIVSLLEVCDPQKSNAKIIEHLKTALTMAFKAGSRAAVKVFTLEQNN